MSEIELWMTIETFQMSMTLSIFYFRELGENKFYEIEIQAAVWNFQLSIIFLSAVVTSDKILRWF